ncbi:MAG: 50S ribosomal protein L30 [Terriglobales bacterium]
MAKAAGKSIRIEYFRSAIGRSWRQKLIVKGLGFTKLRQVVERPDNEGVRGMVLKIPHLVRIVPFDAKTKIHGHLTHRNKAHGTKAHAAKAHDGKTSESNAQDGSKSHGKAQ